MSVLDSIPPLALGFAIFALRIVDVSIGTVRTISMVQGRTPTAVVLGFFEVLVWITVVAQVVTRIDTQPMLAPFYAGGYAAGVGVGMMIERRVSAGRYLVRIITHTKAVEVAAAVGDRGRVVGTFPGATPEGTATLVFVTTLGRRVRDVIAAARAADPTMLYTVEMALGWSENVHPPQWHGQHQRK
jgi:uncharacterized protein YebE (UPF0316 family)